jgi:hypothetical protein
MGRDRACLQLHQKFWTDQLLPQAAHPPTANSAISSSHGDKPDIAEMDHRHSDLSD